MHQTRVAIGSKHLFLKSKWQTREKYPVLMGEVGAQDVPMPFEDKAKFVKPEEWVPDMLGAIQKYRLNWTAWSFHPKCSPCLLRNWDYEPTPYWGEFALRALKGEKFELNKIR